MRDVTYVSPAAIETTIAEYEGQGLKTEVKSNWLKVFGPRGPLGPRVVIAMTKRCGRMDICSMRPQGLLDAGAAVEPHMGVTGGIYLQVNQTAGLTEHEVMDNLRLCLNAVLTAPEVKNERASRKGATQEPQAPAAPPTEEEQAALNASRAQKLAVLICYARDTGTKVSRALADKFPGQVPEDLIA